MAIKIQCPHCKNTMLYQPLRGILERKVCVYCGKSFKVDTEKIVQ